MQVPTPTVPGPDLVREYVTEQSTPKKIARVEFGLLSGADMRRLSEIEGVSDKGGTCGTCMKKLQDCNGHFGYISLELPCFHIGYFKAIISVLQAICKTCSRVLLLEEDKHKWLSKLRNPRIETLQRRSVLKSVLDKCKKVQLCHHCGALNGTVKKIGPLKIIHERFKGTRHEELMQDFHAQFEEAIKANADLKAHLGKAQDDLNPLRVLNLFKRIPSDEVELLDMNPKSGRPERMILTHLLVPPVSIRPSVCMDASQGSNEDDLTVKLMEIISYNNMIREIMNKGQTVVQLQENWDFLQLQCAMYINSDVPGLPNAPGNLKQIRRGLCQRLKGKGGRFRGNLSGKRVDFSGRTVISPDPNLAIDQVAVPLLVAKTMTYPEKVTQHNIDRMRQLVLTGAEVWPGAFYVIAEGDHGTFKTDLRFGKRELVAQNLKIGDVVERHLQDGDIVLFNRQPSLHKLSIMAHKAKVMPWRTFRFNECVCTPYNADFDGDEMNLHVPQTEEARAEAMVLMGVTQNLITPRNGEPLIAATQDFLTSSYLLTRKDCFYTRFDFARILSYFTDAMVKIDLPAPCILKPVRLWTGKQVFNVLIRPNKECNVLVNLETRARTYSFTHGYPIEHMDPGDGFVCFRNSELLSGTLDKNTLGSGSKNNLFHVLMRDYSAEIAADRMSRVAKLSARWITTHGFSIGISDVMPSPSLSAKKKELVDDGYRKCDDMIQKFQSGTLSQQAGYDIEDTLEAKMNLELSEVRKKAGDFCLANLPYSNAPLIMALCGSKGSNLNISQMVACVGQQTVSGKRVPNGFVRRTLPHFDVDSKAPAAKGFVTNSGMTPTEFFFHTMAGREGLVDTAVKTAETGYMQRRLMKALEDLSVQYDLTVRDSIKGIVQFTYGDDGLDPAGMEAKEKPVDFTRVLAHVKAVLPTPLEAALDGPQIDRIANDALVGKFSDCSELFRKELKEYVTSYVGELRVLEERYLDVMKAAPMKHVGHMTIVEKLHRVTASQMRLFLDTIYEKYHRANIEPGTAVGALGAQSIGEMTLKTFHFAGVASMNITLGVPRIKEIINASKTISTPIITAMLVNDTSVRTARILKGRIERTTLGGITHHIKEVYKPTECYLSVKLDVETINALLLEITAESIRKSILGAPKLKLKEKHVQVVKPYKLKISAIETGRDSLFYSLQQIKNALPRVIVSGISTVERAVINEWKVKDAKGEESIKKYNLLVEGYNLPSVMATPGVDWRNCKSNHIIEMQHSLGIEAARRTIMSEIQYTMESHGMSIDTRHVMLLADVMTYKGEVLGITRFGIGKMKDSVLMLASFEKTTDHLFDASVHARKDAIEGVSECIIMGIPVPLGTGLFKVMKKETPMRVYRRPPLLLGDAAMHLSL